MTNWNTYTRDQLRVECKKAGLTRYGSARKDKLVSMLEEHEKKQAALLMAQAAAEEKNDQRRERNARKRRRRNLRKKGFRI